MQLPSYVKVSKEINFLNKLSIATMKCQPRKVVNTGKDGQPGRMPLAIIIGNVTGLRPAVDPQGQPMYSLGGQFEGINIQENNPNCGDRFSSGKSYLPKGFQTMLEGRIMGATSDTLNVGFAVEVGVVEVIAGTGGRPSATGYEYYVKDLSPPAEMDPLDKLRAAAGLPLLGKPIEEQIAETPEAHTLAETQKAEAAQKPNNAKKTA